MNHQIDAGEWLPFDPKSPLRFKPGIAFSMLTRPSLPQPNRAASLTPLQRIDDFVDFQTIFMRMNRQIDAGEWPSFDQKRFLWFRPGIPFSMFTPMSLPQPNRAVLSRHVPTPTYQPLPLECDIVKIDWSD
jgi:hypothetical protein